MTPVTVGLLIARKRTSSSTPWATRITTYRDHRDAFRRIQARGFERDLGWDRAAELYEDRFIDAKYSW